MEKNRAVEEEGVIRQVWMMFASIKLSIIVLLLLAATSVVGTLIPQRPGARPEVGEGLWAQISSFLFLHDMYNSWWFQLLLLLLAVNLIVCSLERLPAVWRWVRKTPRPPRLERVRKLDNAAVFVLKEDLDKAEKKALDALGGWGIRTGVERDGDARLVHGEFGRWTRLGVYAVHLSVLLLLVGGLVGSLFGFSGFVNIPEGDTAHEIRLRGGGGTKDTGFSIRCDSFYVGFYPDGTPREYRSTLTLLDRDGKEILTEDIRVNHPLTYQGVRMYQSSYGTAAARSVSLKLIPEDGEPILMTGEVREPFSVPFTEGHIVLMNFMDNFQLRGHRLGPTFLGFYESAEGKRETLVLPRRHPGFDRMRMGERGFAIEINDYEPLYFTGLQVSKDPGVVLVYLGFTLMLLGCWVVFYLSHRRIFVLLESREEGGVQYTVGGTANRGQHALKQRLVKIEENLKKI
ncbi:cytochrome c biogenesis protein ResB [Desulfobotulus mexicanus]|uniref:Cytochrome c biogenesis protein ResB n=1 Tax=Desulfobotulus mexicanus TaxID=2586642 RepID=A0A5S5MDU1_9BACT|nr:cytochrome c biogenesis protein ResB [Desulfobotulus mexicanus]TYT73867.1 cytochrome c biogenesis protein ResB [Desulfobotulus mexicanus]